jgi:hypothetical protein
VRRFCVALCTDLVHDALSIEEASVIIHRNTDSTFTVTITADAITDCDMELVGRELRSRERKYHLRTGGLMLVKLGPVSFARVSALAVGEQAEF